MKRALGIALFLCVFAAVMVGGHLYIVQRMVLDPGIEAGTARLLSWCVGILGAALVAQPVLERVAPRRWARLVTWPAALWMGFAFLLVVALGASDLVLALAGGVASAADAGTPSPGPARARALVVGAGVLALGAVALRSGLRPPALRRVEVALPRWPEALDGFRIAQISDVHIGPLLDHRFARAVVERVNALEADLVAVTGDLVDGSVRHLADEVAPFGELRARHGAFFVTGNHDHYSGARDWARVVADLGLRVLRNECAVVGQGDARLNVVGVDDHRSSLLPGEHGEDLDRALAGAEDGAPVLLLAHDPSTFKRASGRGIDLQLSGHTHGGQIWPFKWAVRAAIPFVAGLYARGDARLYVSRGTGFWGPPMRLGAPAEITELTLRRAPASD